MALAIFKPKSMAGSELSPYEVANTTPAKKIGTKTTTLETSVFVQPWRARNCNYNWRPIVVIISGWTEGVD
jgi:hypothetical protein